MSAEELSFNYEDGKDGFHYVDVFDGSKKIAHAYFNSVGENKLRANKIFVQEKYRRQGIASKIYSLVEKETNRKIVPSATQSDDAKKFWANRKKNPMITQLDQFTKDQATEFADTEAELKGFPRGGERWKNAFKHYLTFAMGTMSVGRNPRGGHRYKVIVEEYPQVFGAEGFAGRMLKNMQVAEGNQKSLEAVRARILSSVHNLMKLFEAGGLGIKNTTSTDKQGKIQNSEMSELQFPNKEEYSTKEEYESAVKDIVYNWFVRDMVTNCILESLTMFWTLSEQDVADIMDAVTINDANLKEIMGEGRAEFIRRLKAQVEPRIKSLNYKKLVLG